MVVVLGDLIVDITMKFPAFPVQGGDLHRLSYIDIGPGGACNIAIMAARLGLPVKHLGEVGRDAFGDMLLEGLQREGIDTQDILVTDGAGTPSVAVLVDVTAEPAYLGSAGSLTLSELPNTWINAIEMAQVLIADGWIEYDGAQAVILQAFRQARAAARPVFFDPGPGNPDMDNGWMRQAIELCSVLLVNQNEALQQSGAADVEAAGRVLLSTGPELVVIKRGGKGIVLFQGDQVYPLPAYPVEVRDTTGAGDCVAAAVIYAYLHNLALPEMGVLANAVGAAKVRKVGTGHNLPLLKEVQAVAQEFGLLLPF